MLSQSQTLASANYLLSRSCFLCTRGTSLVILDVRSGKYSTLEARYSNQVCDLVPGWPVVKVAETSSSAQPLRPEEIAEDLASANILVQKESRGKHATPVRVLVPALPLIEEYEQLETSISMREAIEFVSATLWALMILSRPFGGLGLRHLEHRCATIQNVASNCSEDTLCILEVRNVLAKFLRLRPLIWKVKNQQRLERLILLKLFEYRKIYPQWILGVAIDPLRSYSWLQWKDFVVDEAPEIVATFTPIVAF
jgi:hypothetical protein